jgi:hypothetical protein
VSYTRDRNRHTRGTGAIAALDGVSSTGRTEQRARAQTMARRDHRLALMARSAFRPMAMGMIREDRPDRGGGQGGGGLPRPDPNQGGGGPVQGPPVVYEPAPTPPIVIRPPINTGPIINKDPVYPGPKQFPDTTPGPLPMPYPDPIPPGGGVIIAEPRPKAPTGGGGTPPIINDPSFPSFPELPGDETLPDDTGMSSNTKWLLLGALALGGYLLWKDGKD